MEEQTWSGRRPGGFQVSAVQLCVTAARLFDFSITDSESRRCKSKPLLHIFAFRSLFYLLLTAARSLLPFMPSLSSLRSRLYQWEPHVLSFKAALANTPDPQHAPGLSGRLSARLAPHFRFFFPRVLSLLNQTAKR